MAENLKIIFILYGFVGLFILLFVSLSILFIKKSRNLPVKYFGVFMDMNFANRVSLGCIFLNFLMILFCTLNIHLYNRFCLYIIVFDSLIFIIFAVNFHLIIAELLYMGVSLIALKILKLTYEYLTNVNYEVKTMWLKNLFSLLIIVYIAFVSVRELELVIKRNKFVRRSTKL